jgi:transposase
MTKLKDVDFKIIFELMKNSKISDRELAKKIGVSQPTVSRKRAKLEKEGLLERSLVFKSWCSVLASGHLKRLQSCFLGKNSLSKCKSFFHDFQTLSLPLLEKEIKREWGKNVATFDSFILSLDSDDLVRPITFKYLGEYIYKDR